MTDVAQASASTAEAGAPTPPAGAAADSPLSSPRLEEFEAEIRKLKVKGSRPEPERLFVVLGIIALVAGFVIAAIGVSGVRSAGDQLEQGDSMSTLILGVGIAIVGAVVWARCSLSRYLRYWLIRDLYEQRASTDRIVDAIDKQSK